VKKGKGLQLEPLCPYCDGIVECEYVDIGVGSQQVTPFQCMECLSTQMTPHHDNSEASEGEKWFGWWLHPDYPNQDLPNQKKSAIMQKMKEDRKYENRNRLERIS
jgi:hypothetical protein